VHARRYRTAIHPPRLNPKRPVLFLDIDGVLNNADHMLRPGRPDLPPEPARSHDFDPESIEALNAIVKAARPYVVLSSTWRLMYSLGWMLKHMRSQGYQGPLHGRTCDDFLVYALSDPPDYRHANQRRPRVDDSGRECWSSHRGDQIQRWLDEAEHGGPVAILDDDGDMAGLTHRWVGTSFQTGLGPEHVERVVDLLR